MREGLTFAWSCAVVEDESIWDLVNLSFVLLCGSIMSEYRVQRVVRESDVVDDSLLADNR